LPLTNTLAGECHESVINRWRVCNGVVAAFVPCVKGGTTEFCGLGG
jgi:hypothetical protein